jgi:hypothetical protein
VAEDLRQRAGDLEQLLLLLDRKIRERTGDLSLLLLPTAPELVSSGPCKSDDGAAAITRMRTPFNESVSLKRVDQCCDAMLRDI